MYFKKRLLKMAKKLLKLQNKNGKYKNGLNIKTKLYNINNWFFYVIIRESNII